MLELHLRLRNLPSSAGLRRNCKVTLPFRFCLKIDSKEVESWQTSPYGKRRKNERIEREKENENHVALMHSDAVQLWKLQSLMVYIPFTWNISLSLDFGKCHKSEEIPFCLSIHLRKILFLNLEIDFLRRFLLWLGETTSGSHIFSFRWLLSNYGETYK